MDCMGLHALCLSFSIIPNRSLLFFCPFPLSCPYDETFGDSAFSLLIHSTFQYLVVDFIPRQPAGLFLFSYRALHVWGTYSQPLLYYTTVAARGERSTSVHIFSSPVPHVLDPTLSRSQSRSFWSEPHSPSTPCPGILKAGDSQNVIQGITKSRPPNKGQGGPQSTVPLACCS